MQKVLLSFMCFLGCILLVKSSWMVPLESACSVNFEYLVASVGFDIHLSKTTKWVNSVKLSTLGT